MARTRTAATLIAEARTLADCVSDPHKTDAEMLVWVAQALAELTEMLIKADPLWGLADTTFVVSDSTVREYALAADFHSILAIDFETGGQRYPVERFSWGERSFGDLSLATSTYGGPVARWRVGRHGTDGADGRVIFDRNPDAGTYRVWYVVAPPATVLGTDAIDGVGGWEDFITLTLAIKMRDKEESDTSVLQADRARIVARINAMAADRDAGEPRQIQDVYSRRAGCWGPLRR